MAHDEKNPVFTERVREQLRYQRILFLDGVLDDDNGTLPSYPPPAPPSQPAVQRGVEGAAPAKSGR